uniref:Uncharacterized protein n=1 Tax=Arundo donax TaxID=35708 RepID=A0A0A9BUM7_ARUDO
MQYFLTLTLQNFLTLSQTNFLHLIWHAVNVLLYAELKQLF